jgi:hypothetical protein
MRIAADGDARARKARVEGDELVDAEVPAAVVCARCGSADCPGCLQELTRSGVVTTVAWERRGVPSWARLWATARATTFEAERFFESLPDGPIAPALKFAIVCELIAAAAMLVLMLVPAALVAPGWLRHALVDQTATVLRVAAVGIPGLAALLVSAHAAHGWALDFGARRSGARGATSRALRFGLYAAGWDLVIGPLGALVLVVREGPRPSMSIANVGPGLPGRSARAFLRGCYRLEGDAARPALRASWVAAGIATMVAALAVISAIVAEILS